MRKTSKMAAGLGALLLGACGGDSAEPPIEQIVVSEPGETTKGTEAGGLPASLGAFGGFARLAHHNLLDGRFCTVTTASAQQKRSKTRCHF